MELERKPLDNDAKSTNASRRAFGVPHRSTADVSQNPAPSAGVQQNAGNFAVQRLFKSGRLQAKLSISRPDDPYEREADRVADTITIASPPVLARKCASCESSGASCASCAAEPEETIQRKSESAAGAAGAATAASSIARLGCRRAAPS